MNNFWQGFISGILSAPVVFVLAMMAFACIIIPIVGWYEWLTTPKIVDRESKK